MMSAFFHFQHTLTPPPPSGKTTLKKPSLIRVKTTSLTQVIPLYQENSKIGSNYEDFFTETFVGLKLDLNLGLRFRVSILLSES